MILQLCLWDTTALWETWVEHLVQVSANEFCYELNEVAFNGPDSPEQPRHVVHFEQGDVWLCDSRIVSHQIVAGRRLLATHMKGDPESMLDPSQRLEARVRRIH